MLKKIAITASLVLSLAAAESAQAAAYTYIPGVTATTDMGNHAGGYDISHIIDGSGLSTPGSFTATHGFPFVSTSWVSSDNTTSGTITFDLHGSYSLGEMAVWNFDYYAGSPGVKDLQVSTSTNGTSFSALVGGPTQFAFAPLNFNGEAAQIFTFAPVTASYVRFNITSTWGDSRVSLNEVGFGSTTAVAAVPEPEEWALMLAGLPLVGWKLRNRKAAAAHATA
jgi:hypothetical protein